MCEVKLFFELYEPHHDRFLKYCEIISKNDDLARDLLHDSILQALDNFSKLRSHDKFLQFLFVIAKNLHRRLLRRSKFWVDYNFEREDFLCSKTRPELDVDIKYLYEKMEELPKSQKEAILLFEIIGYSIKEICIIQDASESAVKQRLKRGREKLRLLMKVSL